jgi:cytochrome c-type biogenesis protein CcmH
MRSGLLAFLIALNLCFAGGGVSLAVEPEEQLKDPTLEARAREISAGLRCLVCQNQSIDDSDAGLAKDLRLLVRQRLQKGESNDQVVDYIVSRYGQFVLLKPRFNRETYLLWLAPLALIAGGVLLVSRVMRNQKPATSIPPLSEEEKKELQALLNGKS